MKANQIIISLVIGCSLTSSIVTARPFLEKRQGDVAGSSSGGGNGQPSDVARASGEGGGSQPSSGGGNGSENNDNGSPSRASGSPDRPSSAPGDREGNNGSSDTRPTASPISNDGNNNNNNSDSGTPTSIDTSSPSSPATSNGDGPDLTAADCEPCTPTQQRTYTLNNGKKCETCLRDNSRGDWDTSNSCASVKRGEGTLPDSSDDGRPTACLGTGGTPASRACLSGCNAFLQLAKSANPCNENIYNAGSSCAGCVSGGAILTSNDGSGNGGFDDSFQGYLSSLSTWCAKNPRCTDLRTGRKIASDSQCPALAASAPSNAGGNNGGGSSASSGNGNGNGAGPSNPASPTSGNRTPAPPLSVSELGQGTPTSISLTVYTILPTILSSRITLTRANGQVITTASSFQTSITIAQGIDGQPSLITEGLGTGIILPTLSSTLKGSSFAGARSSSSSTVGRNGNANQGTGTAMLNMNTSGIVTSFAILVFSLGFMAIL